MTPHTIGLAQARSAWSRLAAPAHAGEPVLLTRYGKPCAALVPTQMLVKPRPRVRFLALRGSGKGLWGDSPEQTLAASRDASA